MYALHPTGRSMIPPHTSMAAKAHQATQKASVMRFFARDATAMPKTASPAAIIKSLNPSPASIGRFPFLSIRMPGRPGGVSGSLNAFFRHPAAFADKSSGAAGS